MRSPLKEPKQIPKVFLSMNACSIKLLSPHGCQGDIKGLFQLF